MKIQYSTVQCSAVQYSTVLYCTAHYSILLYDIQMELIIPVSVSSFKSFRDDGTRTVFAHLSTSSVESPEDLRSWIPIRQGIVISIES